MSKPKVLVARAIFPSVLDRLSQQFDIETTQPDEVWTKEELPRPMWNKVGALTTSS